jgi:hypothetical protein
MSVVLILTLQSGIAAAAESPRELLSMMVGTWTQEGREDTFTETCAWFHNRSHVVCNSESRRASGTSRGVSVFSYSDEKQRFVYYHYGSSGVAVEMDVFLRDGGLYATAERQSGADVTREQVSMTPRTDGSFDFVEESSTNAGPWKTTARVRYIPVKGK